MRGLYDMQMLAWQASAAMSLFVKAKSCRVVSRSWPARPMSAIFSFKGENEGDSGMAIIMKCLKINVSHHIHVDDKMLYRGGGVNQ